MQPVFGCAQARVHVVELTGRQQRPGVDIVQDGAVT
jgi:hypothetical protein